MSKWICPRGRSRRWKPVSYTQEGEATERPLVPAGPMGSCSVSPSYLALPPQTQQSKFVNWQVDGEYRGSDFTAAVTLGNPDVLVGSGKRHRAWKVVRPHAQQIHFSL